MYLVMYTTLLILVFYDTFIKSRDKTSKIIFMFLNIILAIIASIRYYIGTDYGTYVQIFNGVNRISDYSYLEVGFRVLIFLIKKITNKSEALFIFMAIASMTYFYRAIVKLSRKRLISIFIYFSIFYISYLFNAIRQGFAMSIFLYSINYYKNGNLLRILFLTLIASSIHSSGIYILISYMLRNFEVKKKYYPYIVLLCITICLFNPFQQLIIRTGILGRYGYYNAVDIIDIAQRVLILVIFMINSYKFKENDKKIFNIYLLGWIAYCLLSFQTVLATRVNMFFRILEVILFPNLIYYTKDKFTRVIIYLFIILWCTAILIVSLQNPHNYPYKIIDVVL